MIVATLLQGAALFAVLRARFMGIVLDQVSAAKFAGVLMSVTLLKALVEPKETPPWVFLLFCWMRLPGSLLDS